MTGWQCKHALGGECSDPLCRGGWQCQAALGMPEDYVRGGDDPDHVRRQEKALRGQVPHRVLSDFAPATGPDTRQPEMVSKDAVIELLKEAQVDCTNDNFVAHCVEIVLNNLIERVRKL